MGCLSCGRGIKGECNCEANELTLTEDAIKETDSQPPVAEAPKGRPKLSDADVTDPHSTGRKRAAQMWPLDPEAPCEWRDKKNCGGGKHPILGCATGLQRNIHHGPDKNTLNNARTNIHKICTNCHNRWHAANDGDYDPTIRHAPVTAGYLERQMRLMEEAGPGSKNYIP